MNLIDVEGVRLEVRQIDAPAAGAPRCPIVFLHEGLGSVSMWTYQGSDWPERVCEATGRAGVVYSRRGYGWSDPAVAPFAPEYMHTEAFEVLPALLQALNISRPVLLGHSDGATIALLHASRFAVSGCIAMAPHVVVEDVAIESIAKARKAFENGGLLQRLAKYHFDAKAAFGLWNDVWLSPAFRGFDIRAECKTITSPLLLVQGLDDEYGTLRQLDDTAAAAPHAQQVRLADCGHSPHRDQPHDTLRAVAAFLQDTG